MSEGANEENALSHLLDRLTRPGMVDVGQVRSDFDRLNTPGLGLGMSATTQRIAARGGDAAVPVVSGEMVHPSSPDAAAEPAPDEAAVGSARAEPQGQSPPLAISPSPIAATVRAAASLATPAAASPVAAVPAQPMAPAAEIMAALDLVAPISSAPSSEPAAPAEAPVAGGAVPPIAASAGSPLTIVGQPANDIAAELPEPMVIDRFSPSRPAASNAQPVGRGAAPDRAGVAPTQIPAMAQSGSGAMAATPIATQIAASAQASRAPDIAAIADRVRHELLRDLAVEAERRGGQRWRK